MAETFGQNLQERIRSLGPLCAGIDPSRALLLSSGRNDDVEGVEFASLALLDAVVGVAAAIKPQVSFFERWGTSGFRVLERLIRDAHDADVLVIADAKRGDFEPTNEGYAQAWLSDMSPLACDAVTVSPYVGFDALRPFFTLADQHQRGVFVLAATSNEEGRHIQQATTNDNDRVEDYVLSSVAALNRADAGLGNIGVVIGATRDAPRFDITQLAGPILVPGLGAQGASAENVARLFERCPAGSVLGSVSRDLVKNGWERRSLRDSAQRWRDDLTSALF
jgi:orotidine-5'-phosphate decarboxylase